MQKKKIYCLIQEEKLEDLNCENSYISKFGNGWESSHHNKTKFRNLHHSMSPPPFSTLIYNLFECESDIWIQHWSPSDFLLWHFTHKYRARFSEPIFDHCLLIQDKTDMQVHALVDVIHLEVNFPKYLITFIT